MRSPLRAAVPFTVPLALMAAIFAFSAMPSDGADHSVLVLILRKLTHFGEYFLLTALWWWALRTRVGGRRALLPALAMAIGYAVTDEIHQSFVDGRVGTWRDVLIDSAGALTAAWTIRRRALYPASAGTRSSRD